MFTGIIKELGTVDTIRDTGRDMEIRIRAEKIIEKAEPGDSISVNGVCLTIKDIDAGIIGFDVSASTLEYSGLGHLEENDRVNLEDSLTPADRMGGHFVHGHVDAVSRITDIIQTGRSYDMGFELDARLAPYVTERGSIAVDGISLTVTRVEGSRFRTVIIPHTYKNSTLGRKGVGDRVNIEVDMLARYIVNYLSGKDRQAVLSARDKKLREKLEENGFIQ